MALDKQVDHTYASHKCFIVAFPKERDHNYSITRNNVKKGKGVYIPNAVVKGKDYEKWLSEENLSLDISSFDGLAVSGQTKKKSRSTDFEYANPEEIDTCNTVVLCGSWPKENHLHSSICSCFNGVRRDVNGSTDHTYAKETLKQQCSDKDSLSTEFISPEISNFELLSKLSITSDHTYTDKQGEYARVAKPKQRPLIRFDHSYVYKNSIPSFVEQEFKSPSVELNCSKPFISSGSRGNSYMYLGSCESLDVQLSASDTDSCDEANENITEIAFTAWCQLKKDHPYSSF